MVPRRVPLLALPALLCLVAVGPANVAADSCQAAGKNMQCNEFGRIAMDSSRDVRGQAIEIVSTIELKTSFADKGARWVLFSVRNVTNDGPSPVWVVVENFTTPKGTVATTRVDADSPSKVDLWVDVVDLPVGTPITLQLRVGATDRGAYRLETLVMPFDRGYAPVQDRSRADASLFSFTLLGVNRETASASRDDRGFLDGHKLPGLELPAILVAVAGVGTFVATRRRSA